MNVYIIYREYCTDFEAICISKMDAIRWIKENGRNQDYNIVEYELDD